MTIVRIAILAMGGIVTTTVIFIVAVVTVLQLLIPVFIIIKVIT